MKNIMKKFASLALVTSLFVGTLAPTVMAAKPEDKGAQKTLTKTMQMKEGVNVKDSFTFDIEPTTDGPKVDTKEGAPQVEAAPDGLVKLEKTTTDPKVYKDGDSETLNLVYDTTILQNAAPTKVGTTKIFRVKITERKGNREGMIYDESVKYMDIYAWLIQKGKITYLNYQTVIYDKDGNKLKGLDFKNGYGKNPGNDPTPNDNVKELKVTKKLMEMDGKTQSEEEGPEFDVTIKIKGQVGDIFTFNNTPYEITDEEQGVEIKTTIKNKQTLTIDGLTDNDTVEVYESEDIRKTYEVTGQLLTGKALNKITDQTVTIINKQISPVPTGLLNTIAPFILIIGLAGGLGFVYFKKNKNELA